ncbi:hypothetical protein J7E38_15890 [Bacillus sp. ISL-35]|uniref:hypothetical protein n=1 Tax=Bacillus sp. ISL-35 TaxID=2819122 RepID=UPI001BEA334D|nr:hypothetical protein [Bacillus sp. ISL-35]MBT2680492.1 hypothetical protein [Bacillus sp. ISL-35]MBT2704215.1 hypothetical protein [Chryseobacterium sp. ISL-80]
MKKILFLLAFGFILFISANGASAAEKGHYPTAKEIDALNLELNELVEKANVKLANGEKNFELKGKNLKVGFKEKNSAPSSLEEGQLHYSSIAIAAVGSKEYQAYVANTNGWNFSHAVGGTFSWNGSYLTAVTARAETTGIMYSRSESTKVEGLDGLINGSSAKVARVTSNGKFTALKYTPISYYTTLVVEVNAPNREYRITTAKITS